MLKFIDKYLLRFADYLDNLKKNRYVQVSKTSRREMLKIMEQKNDQHIEWMEDENKKRREHYLKTGKKGDFKK